MLFVSGMNMQETNKAAANPPKNPSNVLLFLILCFPKLIPIIVEKLSSKESTKIPIKTIFGSKNNKEINTPVRKFIAPLPGGSSFLPNFSTNHDKIGTGLFSIAFEITTPETTNPEKNGTKNFWSPKKTINESKHPKIR